MPLIGKIENVDNLQKLQFLNLSGNLLTKVDSLSSLESLVELNLRRNKIHTLVNTLVFPILLAKYVIY